MKKLVSLALALVLCLGLTTPAFASETSKVGEASTVSVGSRHMAIVDVNGSLWMCGDGYLGKLGNGTQTSSTTFIKVLDGVNSVSCGENFTAAVKTDGSLWMWGSNYSGALTGDVQESVLTPKKVMDGVVSVSCGNDFAAAIKQDGSLWMWGSNRYGQLGNGTVESSTVPVKVMDGVAAVSCGYWRTAAVKTDGSLWMWGSNALNGLGIEDEDCNGQGESGLSSSSWQTIPIKIMDGVSAVSCAGNSTAVVKTDGSLWVWGDNSYGQLANGTATGLKGSATPSKVLDNVVAVSCSGIGIAAVTKDGSLWTWGSNDCGQLGNGYTGISFGGITGTEAPVQLKPAVVMDDVVSVACSNLNKIQEIEIIYNHIGEFDRAKVTLWKGNAV